MEASFDIEALDAKQNKKSHVSGSVVQIVMGIAMLAIGAKVSESYNCL